MLRGVVVKEIHVSYGYSFEFSRKLQWTIRIRSLETLMKA